MAKLISAFSIAQFGFTLLLKHLARCISETSQHN